MIAAFLGISLLVAAAAVATYFKFACLEQHVDEITQSRTPAALRLVSMRACLMEAIEEALAYMLFDDPHEKDGFYERMAEFDVLFDEFLQIADFRESGQEHEAEWVNQIKVSKQGIVDSATEAFDIYQRTGKVDLPAMQLLEEHIDKCGPAVEALIATETAEVIEAHEAREEHIARSNAIMLSLILTVTVLALALGLVISRSISVPITRLKDAALRISQGKLDTLVDVKSTDEIGQLGDSFNKMTSDLKHSMEKLKNEVRHRKLAEDELSKEQKFIVDALNTMSDVFYVFDFQGKCLRWNKAFSKTLGYTDDEIATRSPIDYFTGSDVQVIAKAMERISKGQSVTVEAALNAKDGRSIPFEFNGAPLKDFQGNPKAFCGVGRDISDRTKAEQSLKQLNADLSLTATKLEESNRELQNFAYIASHDLREPLRKISSFGALLQEALGGKLNDDDEENLGFMVNGAERMQQMIEGLLVYSRLERKEITFESVDLNLIISELQQVELAVPLEDSAGQIEVPQPLPSVLGDSVQIRQLLQNLIANGIKYHHEQNQPRIQITSKTIDDETLRIEIQDNGIGIKKDFHKDIFAMFRRLHSRSKYQGAGIGLAVCKKIVDKHGGQIGIESEEQQGSTFWFTLPLAMKAELPSVLLEAVTNP